MIKTDNIGFRAILITKVMRIFVSAHVVIDRLAKSFPVLSFLVGLTMVMSAFNYYHVVGFIYLLLDGLHQMIRGYRTSAYDNLVNDHRWVDHLKPGAIVYTDKKFNGMITGWCLLLGLLKTGASFAQFQYFAPDEMSTIIFYIAISLAGLVIISEVILLVIIAKGKQAEFLSIYMATPFEYYPNMRQGCQAYFRVVKPPDSSPTVGIISSSNDESAVSLQINQAPHDPQGTSKIFPVTGTDQVMNM
jgi:hypothetical protein